MGDNLPALRASYLVDDLDGQAAALRNPITGEIHPLDDENAIADWLIAAKAIRAALTVASRIASAAILPAMDRNARWTINRPGGSVTAPSPAPSQASDTWDGNRLYQVLEDLVSQGVISKQALSDAVQIKTEYVAKTAGVKALLKLPDVAPYIETCRAEQPEAKPRSASVK